MAWFRVLNSMAWCHVLLLLQQTVASPVIEAYKPKENDKMVSNKMKVNVKKYIGSMQMDLQKMLKKLEHKIDDAEVRERIMVAQISAPFAFKNKRMAAALEFINTKIPSIIYNASKIVSGSSVFLQIFNDGTVNGTMEMTSPYAILTLESIGSGGVFRIKGTKSQKYLVYKENGRVMAESGPPTHESIFRTGKGFGLLQIESLAYGWCLGFRHNMKMKKGARVKRRPRHRGSLFAVIARMG